MDKLTKLKTLQLKPSLPEFRTGDTLRVHQVIQEGNKERIQVFEGVVICRKGRGIDGTFTVRKVSYNVGVERTFPIHSPRVNKIEVKQRGKVRRSRLYYLRELRGKAAKIKQNRYFQELAVTPEEQAAAPAVES